MFQDEKRYSQFCSTVQSCEVRFRPHTSSPAMGGKKKLKLRGKEQICKCTLQNCHNLTHVLILDCQEALL